MRIFGYVGRFFVSVLVLYLVAWMVPGFVMGSLRTTVLFAFMIAVIAWFGEKLWIGHITPFGRGLVGFFASIYVIWMVQYFADSVKITILGALLAAVVIGMCDLFIPTRLLLGKKNT